MKGAKPNRYISRGPQPGLFRSQRKSRLRLVCILLLALVIILWQKRAFVPTNPRPIGEPTRTQLSLPQPQEKSEKPEIKRYIVKEGDSLYAIFKGLDLSIESLAQCSESCPDFSELNQLQPEDELTIHINGKDQEFSKLVYSSGDGSTYIFDRVGTAWACEKEKIQPAVGYETARGTITDCLYDSCVRNEVPAALILDLADLFAYDIDFNTDIQQGDTFAVHYEEQLRKGKAIGSGPILAAEMVVGGRSYKAFFYELPDGFKGYFDEKGRSLRKLFLKAPLSYSRISSTFTRSRFHPILRIFRPHLGIDYAAPKGTPVSALGSGTITYLGRKGGFGRYVEIRHNATFKTSYGHLDKFTKGLRRGSRVNQGDVIGYVGSSGLATGPHLDFRFFKKGRPINFLKTEFPRARSIPQSLRADFEKKRQVCLAALRGRNFTQLNNTRKGLQN